MVIDAAGTGEVRTEAAEVSVPVPPPAEPAEEKRFWTGQADMP
jgi:hypothetical protein